VDDRQLTATAAAVLDRWPSAGIAAGVVRDGSLQWFLGHGVSDVASQTPVTPDTVFRIGSVTKTMTAVAIMQLTEQGLVDLDAPAADYLRSFSLVPAKASFRPVTVRHLLTHTGGVGYLRRWSDLLRPGLGTGIHARRPVGTLADYYRSGLPVVIEPGTRWVYSNHGFAVLGQIVEDVAGQPFDHYLCEHLFAPLGMDHSDLTRSQRVAAGLAAGYVVRARGLKPVKDHDIPTAPGGAVYASARDVARYVAALLGGGANNHGTALRPETVASMVAPHFQPDARVPGMGLSFQLDEQGGHRVAAKTGIVSGFLAAIALAPDDGIGVFALTNTGGLNGQGAAEPLATALLRQVLGLPDQAIRTDILPRSHVWSDLSGWYGMDPGPLANLFDRLGFGAGAEVSIREGSLWFRPLSAIPTMRHGFRLHPDDEYDPYVFRLDLTDLGMGTFRAAFTPRTEAGRTRHRFEAGFVSLQQRPDALNPRRWATGLGRRGGRGDRDHPPRTARTTVRTSSARGPAVNRPADTGGPVRARKRAAAGPGAQAAWQRRAVLAAAVLGTALAYMCDDMLNLAIPSVARDLHAGTTAVQWILNAYYIPLVAFVLVAGSLGDSVGHRRTFTAGLLLFGGGALLCAGAPGVALLVAGRALQGLAAAMLLAAGLALVTVANPGARRDRAVGQFVALAAAVPALGPFLSGALVNWLSWRWLFVAPLVLPLAALAITRTLWETPRAADRRPDVPGSVAALLALCGISVALIAGPAGASMVVVGVAAAIGVVAGIWFVRVEQHAPDPLLPLGLLRRRRFVGANTIWLLAAMTSWAAVFFLAVNLQIGLELRPLTTGLLLTPIYVIMMAGSPLAGAAAGCVGRRRIVVTGLAVYAAGLWLLGTIDAATTVPWGVLGPLVVFAVGMATFTAPVAAAAMSAVDDQDQGVASGVNNAMGQLAGLLAIIVLPAVAGLGSATSFAGSAFTAAYPRALHAAAAMAALGIPLALATLPRRHDPPPLVSDGHGGQELAGAA
jgi:CubicO group peptidase (beta-lactamase class C family)/MFS family permease